MGLSRKLAGAFSRAGPEPADTAVPYKWSTQTYTMAQLLKKFKLPCVVQCATDSCTVVWSDFQFDLRQPLLLHERRTVKKVHSISLSAPKTKAGSGEASATSLEEVGPPMAIPCDYEGWFGGAPKGESKAKRHLRIEGVAKSTARRFIVTTKLPAFTSSRAAGGGAGSGNGDANCYVPHEVQPGEVLKRVCVLDPGPDDLDCPAVVKEFGPCLECLDEKDEDVIIPFSRRAILYEVAESYPEDVERVFTAAQVVDAGNSKLPRVLKLAHGEPPQLAYAFTGMLRCYSIFTEETVLAATLDDVASICLELGTDSSAQFRLALNEAAVKRTCEYGNALHMCESAGPKYLTSIKVSFSLQPEVTELEDIDLSFYESQVSCDDIQEVEANSEFEISWGAVKKARLMQEASGEIAEADVDEALEGKNKNFTDEGKDTKLFTKDVEQAGKDNGKRLRKADGDFDEGKNSSDNSQHEFTERDVKELMKRKGMLENSSSIEDNTETSEAGALFEQKTTENPLYHYFQTQETVGPSSDSETDILEGNASVNANGLSKLFQERLKASSSGSLPDVVTTSGEELNYVEEVDLDISVYEQAVRTPAREFSEAEVDDTDSSDGNSSGDDGEGNKENVISARDFRKPTTPSGAESAPSQFYFNETFSTKPGAQLAMRAQPNAGMAESARRGVLGHTIDTSSSDELFSDHERNNSKMDAFLSNLKNRALAKDTAKSLQFDDVEMRPLSDRNETPLSSSDETGHFDSLREYHGSKSGFNSSSPEPVVPVPPKAIFTEVDDDPLETTMSELDKITSVKPLSLLSSKYASEKNLSSSSVPNKSEKSQSLNRKGQVKGFKTSSKWISEEIVSPPPLGHKGKKDAKSTERTNLNNNKSHLIQAQTRPKNMFDNLAKKKHADVMQKDDRFDSPKVAHYPHIHPHGTFGEIDNAQGHVTMPVPLSRAGKANVFLSGPTKSKVLSSVLSFERLNTTDHSSEPCPTSTFSTFKPNDTSPISLHKQTNKSNTSMANKNMENSNSRENISPGIDKAQPKLSRKAENGLSKASSFNNSHTQNADSPKVPLSFGSKFRNGVDKSDARQYISNVDGDSDEELVTVEEVFMVSTDLGKASALDLKVLPVYAEDMQTEENFV